MTGRGRRSRTCCPGCARAAAPTSRARPATAGRSRRPRLEPRRGRPGRPGAGRRAAGPPRPALRLPRARVDGRRGAARASRVKVRFAGQDVDGFVVERVDDQRPRRAARAAAPGGQRRAGADAGRRRAGRRRRRALRRRPLRRTAPRGAAAARHDREAALAEPAPRAGVRSAERGGRGLGATRPAAPYLRHLARPAGRRGRSGARRPGRTGRGCSPTLAAATAGRRPRRADLRPRPPRRRRASTPPCATVLGPDQHVTLTGRRRARRPRYRDFLAGQPRRPPDRGRHPGAPPSRRSTTSAWSRSGTTATTSTPSRGRPTPTPARCCCCGPSVEGGAALVGGFARSVEADHLLQHRVGPARSRRRARPCASGSPWRHRGHRPRARARPARRRRAGARARRTTPSGAASSAGRCWCRRRGPATSCAWPATAAARRPGARPAPGRCS